MKKRWVYKDSPAQPIVEKLCAEINVSSPISTILAQRGIQSFQDAKAFFRPQLEQLHDPFLMKDMDRAVARVLKAIEANERIMVYGDYDVDGTTSVALFYGYLNSFHFNSEFYIPDRYKEGYGISKQGIDYAQKNGITLIVALDCGIKSVELTAYAKSIGVDFIICDHHRPGEAIPDVAAVLDPKRADCDYPFKELSGCGIGFKLVQALDDQLPDSKSSAFNYLDLVAVSIASDIVPIVGENRVLAYFGIEQLSSNPSPGLKALIQLAGIQNKMSITGIVFGLAPRINAAGRISHAKGAVELLLASTEDEAFHFAEKLDVKNNKRRDVDTSITEEALQMIDEKEHSSKAKSTVLFKESWHKGVIGIVASRCIEKHYKPTIILTESENKATGSARSVHGFDVYNAIEACSDLLDQFGGHMYAAGLTLPLENVTAFEAKFEEVVASSITESQLVPRVEIDSILELDQITPKFNHILKQMEPFGPENLTPIFVTKEVKLASSLKVLKNKHLKLSVTQKDVATSFECIGFGLAEYEQKILEQGHFNIAYSIEENEFRGVKTLQLNIKDIQFD